MKTLKDLGALVKRKHPEYSDMTDLEVGQKVKALYPDEYADFVDPQSVEGLLDYYNPKIGRLRSWWRGYKSEGRGKMLSFMTTELTSILEQGAALEESALSSKQKRIELQSFIAHNQYLFYELQQKADLLDQATKRGMTVETLQTVQIAQSVTDEQIKLQTALSSIKLHEFKETESIKFNNELKKMQEQVRLALIAKALSSHQRVMLVQELLDGLYKQIEEVEHSSLKPATKQRMIEDRESIISHFKGYRDAEGSRLLQTD